MNILIVDDEEVLQDVLTSLVRREGWNPLVAKTGEEALQVLRREEVDLMLLDLMLPGMSGMEVLKQIQQQDRDLVVVVITAFSSIEGAIEAMREGAFHYIPKPFKNEEVVQTIRKGLEQQRLARENRALRAELQQRYAFDNIIGKSKPMQTVFELVRLAAPSKSNILILGDSGTGKELVAKAIHHHSRRAGGPFITVNSGSMPHDLLESNLFGHVKGAFTGAISSKKGLFELAGGGSIFFDEIGNIPPDTQAKLLRVIQEKEFMRLGGVDVLKADVRIIAATNADLDRLVADRSPAAAQESRGHPAPRAPLPRPLRGGEREGDLRDRSPGDGDADGLPLAGERARARERDRAGHGAVDHRGARRRAPAADGPSAPGSRRPAADAAVERHLVQAGGGRLRAPADRQGPEVGERGAEAGRRAAQGQADDAPRDDEAAQDNHRVAGAVGHTGLKPRATKGKPPEGGWRTLSFEPFCSPL